MARAQELLCSGEANPEWKQEEFVAQFNACAQSGRHAQALQLAVERKRRLAALGANADLSNTQLLEGAAYQMMGLYPQALEIYRGIDSNGFSELERVTQTSYLNNLAEVFMRIGDLTAAQRTIERALELLDPVKDALPLAMFRGTQSEILLAQKEFALARTHAEYCRDAGIRERVHLLTVLCGKVVAETWLAEGKADFALKEIDMAIALAEAERARLYLPEVYLTRARVERQQKRLLPALQTTLRAIALAEQSGEQEATLKAWRSVADLQSTLGNHDEALAAWEEVEKATRVRFDDSLAKLAAVARIEQEVSAKEQQIERLQNRYWLVGLSATGIGLLCIAVFTMVMRRRDHRRAKATEHELKMLNELKDQLLANTSHEFRTPLNGIIGMADLLLTDDRLRLTPDAREQLQTIRTCGEQLNLLVNDILDLSRMRAVETHLQTRPVALLPLMTQLQHLFLPLASHKRVQLRIDLPPADLAVPAERDRLQQIFSNLLGNAIKFTDSGEVQLSVTASEAHVHFAVRDTGIGIPLDKLQSIFEPFSQVDPSARRRHEGVGLGLAIARQLVRAHGSELRVHSDPGKGSTFYFELPRIREAAQASGKIATDTSNAPASVL